MLFSEFINNPLKSFTFSGLVLAFILYFPLLPMEFNSTTFLVIDTLSTDSDFAITYDV